MLVRVVARLILQPPNSLPGAGYMAHVCVSSTARAGDELGYDISVVKDGIGDRDVPGATASQLVEVSDYIPKSL